MATLYVENVPDDLYEALRSQAKARRRSIAAEVLALLEENVPTARDLKSRHEWVRKLARLRKQQTASGRAFPSTEEMIREDRQRRASSSWTQALRQNGSYRKMGRRSRIGLWRCSTSTIRRKFSSWFPTCSMWRLLPQSGRRFALAVFQERLGTKHFCC